MAPLQECWNGLMVNVPMGHGSASTDGDGYGGRAAAGDGSAYGGHGTAHGDGGGAAHGDGTADDGAACHARSVQAAAATVAGQPPARQEVKTERAEGEWSVADSKEINLGRNSYESLHASVFCNGHLRT